MPSMVTLIEIFIDAAIMVGAIIIFTRLAGLRSFSKMSSHDFAITVAIGSVLASVVVGTDTGAVAGVAALGALFTVQVILSRLRVRSDNLQDVIDNAPLLIMRHGEIFDDNLNAAKMTRSDLMGKLREANVLQLSEVQAVVFEPTGGVSVLHGQDEIDEALLEGVLGSAPS